MVASSARFFRIDFGGFGFEVEAMAMADVNDAREFLVLLSGGALYMMYIPRRKKTGFEVGKYNEEFE